MRRLKFRRIHMQIRASLRRFLWRTAGSMLFLGISSPFGVGSLEFAQVIGAPERSEASTNELVTFNKDVAPIIFQHCSTCHRPGQAAPFALLGYADAKRRAKQISDVVRKRYMPPWLPESGAVEFASDLSLTDGQIRLIDQWVNESLLKENPSDAVAHTKAGRANMYFGDVGKAMDHFLAAVKADPKYDRAYFELGSIYLRQQRLPEALEAFENVTGFNPDDYEAEGSLGIIFLRRRELDQAEIHFRAALRLNPQDKLASNYLGRVLEAKANLRN